jgi:hypothetical protein
VAINERNPRRYNGKSFYVTRRNSGKPDEITDDMMRVDVQHAKEASKQEGRDD